MSHKGKPPQWRSFEKNLWFSRQLKAARKAWRMKDGKATKG